MHARSGKAKSVLRSCESSLGIALFTGPGPRLSDGQEPYSPAVDEAGQKTRKRTGRYPRLNCLVLGLAIKPHRNQFSTFYGR